MLWLYTLRCDNTLPCLLCFACIMKESTAVWILLLVIGLLKPGFLSFEAPPTLSQKLFLRMDNLGSSFQLSVFILFLFWSYFAFSGAFGFKMWLQLCL